MRLENSFEVAASPESAWDLLMDVPRVIPCMPGAELTETVDDATWKARMTVKLGPMSFAFATDVKREATDEAARRARLSARARELKGRGGGQASIESTLVPLDGGTRVEIVTDLSLSGAVAQYGRGMVEDVSSQLVTQFADCLKAQLADSPERAQAAVAGQAKPVAALPLAVRAVRRRIVVIVRRLARRRKSSGRSGS